MAHQSPKTRAATDKATIHIKSTTGAAPLKPILIIDDQQLWGRVRRLRGRVDQITLDRYSHLYEDDLEDLADSMDARYGAAQVRPKPGSRDIVDLDEKRNKADAPAYSERLGPRSSGDRAPVS